jgi:hypothetical protein
LYGFVSATFWGGVIAMQCPIAAPKRQLQPERYVQWRIRFKVILNEPVDKKYEWHNNRNYGHLKSN